MCTQTKHTPGPWNLSEDGDLVIGKRGPFRLVKGFMAAGGMPDAAEALANANLIAAAPELLQACKDALAAFEYNGFYNPYQIGGLKDAIAKAEGTV